jgi:hypothetical protein
MRRYQEQQQQQLLQQQQHGKDRSPVLPPPGLGGVAGSSNGVGGSASLARVVGMNAAVSASSQSGVLKPAGILPGDDLPSFFAKNVS